MCLYSNQVFWGRRSLRSSFRSSLRSSLWSSLRSSLRSTLRSNLRSSLRSSLGKQHCLYLFSLVVRRPSAVVVVRQPSSFISCSAPLPRLRYDIGAQVEVEGWWQNHIVEYKTNVKFENHMKTNWWFSNFTFVLYSTIWFCHHPSTSTCAPIS
jgi:hypothetical protein